MTRTPSFWENERLTLEHAIELTIESLRAHGWKYRHWAIAYSGGKDSTATVTLICWLLATEQIPAPESLTVFYADTRMELPPLHACALTILEELRVAGMTTQIVYPALDHRFFVYLFGRGVPAPKNRFRWCTPQLKIEPMERAIEAQAVVQGLGAMVLEKRPVGEGKLVYQPFGDEKALVLTGVRLGESAARDQRIALSCSRDGAECGQGWLQYSTPESVADVLAPILHWRVCHVWDWLSFFAPGYGFSTQLVAEAYGGDEAEEINARTGCVGCNLASKDVALDALLKLPQWAYLAPFKRLKPLYQELMRPQYRLRKNGERKKDGRFSANPMRMGPYTMEARRYGLAQVLGMQDEINATARAQGRPLVDLINTEEHARILALIDANTWPNGWSGDEVTGDVLLPRTFSNGALQPLLIDKEVQE